MSVVLYSTDCPQCKVLKSKLDEAGIQYELVTDVDAILDKGFTVAPVMETDEKSMMFRDAIKWINDLMG